MDTRPGGATIDSQFSGAGTLKGGQVVTLKVLGRGGRVPASGVSAVALNVAITQPSRPSHLTVFPAGVNAPNTANLNFTAGQTISNMVIAKIGANGSVSFRLNAGEAHLVVDIAGWFGD